MWFGIPLPVGSGPSPHPGPGMVLMKMTSNRTRLVASLLGASFAASFPAGAALADEEDRTLNAGEMPLVHTIDERYMSFQIGMSHLTGGETWSSYDESKGEGEAERAEGFEAVREARAPTDLSNRRLRKLTEALGPLYIRYGGTTTNSVYFQDNDEPRLAEPPEGFQWILTRNSWENALDFAAAMDAKVVTGFTVSEGVRDKSGAWTPVHAAPWMNYTRSIGGEIYAAELH